EVMPGGRLPRVEEVEVVRGRDRDEGRDQRDDHDEADDDETGERLRVAQEQHEPAGDPDAPASAWRNGLGPLEDGIVEDRGLELRHQLARSRGSRTRLSTSMTRFARMTATRRTTRIAGASG